MAGERVDPGRVGAGAGRRPTGDRHVRDGADPRRARRLQRRVPTLRARLVLRSSCRTRAALTRDAWPGLAATLALVAGPDPLGFAEAPNPEIALATLPPWWAGWRCAGAAAAATRATDARARGRAGGVHPPLRPARACSDRARSARHRLPSPRRHRDPVRRGPARRAVAAGRRRRPLRDDPRRRRPRPDEADRLVAILQPDGRRRAAAGGTARRARRSAQTSRHAARPGAAAGSRRSPTTSSGRRSPTR